MMLVVAALAVFSSGQTLAQGPDRTSLAERQPTSSNPALESHQATPRNTQGYWKRGEGTQIIPYDGTLGSEVTVGRRKGSFIKWEVTAGYTSMQRVDKEDGNTTAEQTAKVSFEAPPAILHPDQDETWTLTSSFQVRLAANPGGLAGTPRGEGIRVVPNTPCLPIPPQTSISKKYTITATAGPREEVSLHVSVLGSPAFYEWRYQWVSGAEVVEEEDPPPAFDPDEVRFGDLHFYEGGSDAVPSSERNYQSFFVSAETRFIWWESELSFPAPDELVSLSFEAVWYSPDGSVFGRKTYTANLQPNTTSTYFSSGRGWSEPGRWPPGEYRVELLREDATVASGSFEVGSSDEVEEVLLFDVNPLFTEGLNVDGMDATSLLENLSTHRVGVVADGESQVLLRVELGSPGKTRFLIDEEESGGTLEALFDGATHEDEDGDYFAFAIYTAPEGFGAPARANPTQVLDGRVEYRDVRFRIIQRKPGGGEPTIFQDPEELKIRLARPPVVLVHGTFDNRKKCWTISASGNFTSGGAAQDAPKSPEHGNTSMEGYLRDRGFYVSLVDYEKSNGMWRATSSDISSFKENRRVIWQNPGGLYDVLSAFRDDGGLNLAITQVDVVGHSLGGLIPRLWVSASYNPSSAATPSSGAPVAVSRELTEGYTRPDNGWEGDINRLVTIASTHFGSDLSDLMLALASTTSAEAGRRERWRAKGVLTWIQVRQGAGLTKAVRDQTPHPSGQPNWNDALRKIGVTPVPAHAIVCVATTPDLVDFGGEYRDGMTQLMTELVYKQPDTLKAFLTNRGRGWLIERFNQNEPHWFEEHLHTSLQALRFSERDLLTSDNELANPSLLTIKDQAVLMTLFRAAIFGNTQNDMTVRVESQLGGLPLQYTTMHRGVLHGFAPRYERVQRNVADLLSGPEHSFCSAGFPETDRHLMNAGPLTVDQDPVERERAIAASGLIRSHANSIAVVARLRNEIIMLRPINKNGARLIGMHCATKDMHTKGKSANFGPQKGYIPVQQRFSKLHFEPPDKRAGKIDKFDRKVQDSLLEVPPRVRKVPLEVLVAGAVYEVRVIDGVTHPFEAIVLRRKETGEYYDWRNDGPERFSYEQAPRPEGTGELAGRQTSALEVLADARTGRPLTADYDLLATATRTPPEAVMNDPERGSITASQVLLLRRINHAIRVRDNYLGGNVCHHGPEMYFGGSEGVDYPITIFETTGYIFSVAKGPAGRQDANLKRYFDRMKRLGWHLAPNPVWGWGEWEFRLRPGWDLDTPSPPNPDTNGPDNQFDSNEGGDR
jgi:hypothetical protein